MKRFPSRPLAWFISVALGSGVVGSVAAKPPTIADLRSRQVEVRRDVPVQADAAKAKVAYEQFLQLERGDEALRAEAMRRLADLKLTDGEFARIEQDLAQGSPLETSDAILLYRRLLETYPGYARNDAVLYQLARALDADGQPDESAAVLARLVTEYPKSALVDEAWFRRAEALFMAKRWVDAQAAYQSVIDRGPSGAFHEQALYKQGWTLFKQSENEASIGPFLVLLDRKLVDAANGGGLRDLQQMPRAERELVEDTFRALSLDFSYLEGAKSIDAALTTRGSPVYTHLLYAQLGDLYLAKQRYTDAADTYRAYVKRAPDSDPAPLLLLQALAAYTKGGFLELVVDAKREFVARYSLGQPYWNGRTLEGQPAVVRDLKANLRDLAQYHHSLAQREKKQADFLEAAHWYRQLLEQFPSDADAAQTRYLLADALIESGQLADAAKEYGLVAYEYPGYARAADAGYAGVVAFDREEARLPVSERAAWHEQAQAAALKFATAFPQHPEVALVLGRAAKDLYDRKEYGRAIAVAEQLLQRGEAVDVAKRRLAWGVVANAHFDAAEWAPAEAALQQLLSLVPAQDADRPVVLERLAVAVYRQGEALQAAGDNAGAVSAWLRVRELAPLSKVRSTADYDAGALLFRSREWTRAITVLERFRTEFPKDALQAQVTRSLAIAYAEAGQPLPAAAEYLRIADAANEPLEARREALWKAAEIQEAAGGMAAAARTYERYVAQYRNDAGLVMEAQQKLADHARARGAANDRTRWLQQVVAVDRGAGAARTARTRTLAATAALELAAPARDAYQRVNLTIPLKKSLAAKRAALEKALKAYEAAGAYGMAEVATAATFETGELYRGLAQALLASERPRKLDADALEQYNLLLEDQADPFNEKAIAVLEVNVARLAEGYYDPAVQKTLDVLAKLKAGRYGKTEDSAFFSVAVAGVEPAAAREQLEKVLRADPANGLALVEYAHVLRLQGNLPDAETAYRRALALRPRDARVQRNVAVFLDIYRQRPAEALPLFESVASARTAAGEPDDRLLNGWIAELRARLGVKPVPASGSTP